MCLHDKKITLILPQNIATQIHQLATYGFLFMYGSFLLPLQHPSLQPSHSVGLNKSRNWASSRPILAPTTTPAHNMCSQVQNCTIIQEAILACMNTYSYITSCSPTPANTACQSFPAKILNTVLNMDTGALFWKCGTSSSTQSTRSYGASSTPPNWVTWPKVFPASAKAPIPSY